MKFYAKLLGILIVFALIVAIYKEIFNIEFPDAWEYKGFHLIWWLLGGAFSDFYRYLINKKGEKNERKYF